MKNIKTTIYIVSHNYGKYLEAAIESVLRQTIDDWELIIIDDNSSDNTSAIMNFYKGDSRIRLFSTPGIGLPAVCNFALEKSRGKYFIRLDGDDIFEENILLVLNNYLDRNPECSMVFPDYYLIDEFGRIFAHEKREKIYENNHVPDMPANGACCLIRANILKDVGGYREDLRVQDGYDLWNKLNGKYKIANVNVPLFYYRRHKNNLTNKSHQILSARRQIKLENVIDKLDHYRPITAVIPCRQNYDFCPDVWKREIKGRSLLQLSIEKCICSEIFDHIIVASDNPEVQSVINLFNCAQLSFLQRKPEDTIRSKSLVPTIEKIIAPIDPAREGLTVIAYIQAPFVTSKTLKEAIFTLILNDTDCAFGVEEVKYPLFKRTAYGLEAINPRNGISTDFDIIYRESNVSLATKNRNLNKGSLTGPSVVNFTVSNEEYFFIDSEQKMRISEIIAED